MKLLLDTHAVLWWFLGSENLPSRVRKVIKESEVFVSAASAWEISIKYSLGKLVNADIVLDDFEGQLAQDGFSALPISLEHAIRAGALVRIHGDPFDRLLVSQAQTENLAIVSNDRIFDRYGLHRVW